MAYASTHHVSNDLRHTLTRPFVAIGNMLVALAKANRMAQEADRISEMSDATLAAKGLTREQAIAHIFRAHGHI